jgi:hypothetical protein
LKHTISLKNQKTFLKTVIAIEGQEDEWNQGHVLQNNERLEEYRDKYSYPFYRFAFQANHKFNTKTTIRAGANYSIISYNMFARKFNDNYRNYDTIISKNGNTSQTQIYTHINRRLTSNLEAGFGLHFMYYALNDRHSIEPRASLKWSLTDKQSLNFGFGVHTRAECVVAYLAPVSDSTGKKYEANRNLDFTRAFHYIIGYDQMISNNFRIKTEIYYQYLTLVPLDSRPGSYLSSLNASYGVPDIPLVNKGKGYNYGLEMTLEKFYTDNYYFLATFSLFDSKYQTVNGKWFNTYFNSNYIANFLGGKDFLLGKTKQNILGLNIKLTYRGGFRYTPIDQDATDISGELVMDNNKFNEKQAPDFISLNMGLNYRRNNKGYSWIITFDIQNILDRQNVLGYEVENKKLEPIIAQGLIPILNFKIEF